MNGRCKLTAGDPFLSHQPGEAMKLQRKGWMAFSFLFLLAGGGLPPHVDPPVIHPDAQIVRIRIGYSCGWCSGGYNENETTVESGSIVTIARTYSNKQKFPDINIKYGITKQDWEDLQHFLDVNVMGGFTGPIGCPGCVDRPEEWAEVQFS